MKRIAFLGVGIMGTPMALNLVRAGFELVVWNRTKARCRPLAELGAKVAPTPAAAVSGADVDAILYSLGEPAAVDDVVFGAEGILAGVRHGQVAVDLSTSHPEVSRRQERAFRNRGVDFLDAPVFGSVPEAETAALCIVVGGDGAALCRVRAVLGALSSAIYHMGPVGAGAAMGLIGSLIVGLQLQALAEALILGQKAGLDPRQVLEVIQLPDFRSPLFGGMGGGILKRDFRPIFSLKHMQKDADFIAQLAQQLNVPLPGSAIVREVIKAAVNQGGGDENASALIKALEVQANLVVRG